MFEQREAGAHSSAQTNKGNEIYVPDKIPVTPASPLDHSEIQVHDGVNAHFHAADGTICYVDLPPEVPEVRNTMGHRTFEYQEVQTHIGWNIAEPGDERPHYHASAAVLHGPTRDDRVFVGEPIEGPKPVQPNSFTVTLRERPGDPRYVETVEADRFSGSGFWINFYKDGVKVAAYNAALVESVRKNAEGE